MAGSAGAYPNPCSTLLQVFYLSLGFQSDLMTSSTAFHPFHQSHGLPMCSGHCFHGCPGGRMFSGLELLHPCLMTHGTGIGSWNLNFGNILGRFVLVALAFGATDLVLEVFAHLPVIDNPGRDLLVTIDTDLRESSRNKNTSTKDDQK